MISFVIPTWNRAEKLRACVESIAKQGPDAIFISDDCSTDETPKVLQELARKYPFVRHQRNADRLGFTGNYRQAVSGSQSRYTWTFGDDDTLVDGALSHVLAIMRSRSCDFYHVAEVTRANRNEAVLGRMWEICNNIGWLEFTGFISCNIADTEKLKAGVNSENWALYGRSAYPQCLAILEQMVMSTAMMLEVGCVIPGTFTDETANRWKADNIGWRYLYVGDGLRRLHELNAIPPRVEESFFRYIEGSLFDRLMRDFGAISVSAPFALKPADWDCLEYMVGMVNGARGGLLRAWVASVRGVVAEEEAKFRAAADAAERLYKAMNNIQLPVYPTAYLPTVEKDDVAA